MFKTLRPTAVPLLQVLLVCGQLVFSALAAAAPKAKPPLDVLFLAESRLVVGSLVEKNPAGRLVFKREKVYGQSTDVPELIDVRAEPALLDSTRIGTRYVIGYSLFHRDKRDPSGYAENRKGAILINTSGLQPALFEDSRLIHKILSKSEDWEGRHSAAMKRLLMKALEGPEPALQLLAAAQFVYAPALSRQLASTDRRMFEQRARDAAANPALRELMLIGAIERPSEFGGWAGSAISELLASTPSGGYPPGTADLTSLVLLAFDETLLHRYQVPFTSLTRWLHSPQRVFVERSTALLGVLYPTRQANALEEALGDSSLTGDTRKYIDDQLRIIRGPDSGTDTQQQGPG